MKKLWMIGVIMLFLGGAVHANAFSGYTGCVADEGPYTSGGPLQVSTYGQVNDAGNNPIAAGSPRVVQYIYIGSDDHISDPDAAGAVRVGDFQVNGTTYYVGDDSDTGATFTGRNGQFFHGFAQSDGADYSAVASGGNQFFVRVWDRTPSDPGALFGDSALFSPAVASGAGDPPPTPNNVGLATFKVQFPKAAPAAPAVGSASGISSAPPSATINWTSALGARYYSYQVAELADTSYTSPVASGTVRNNSRWAASTDSATAKNQTVSLGTLGDDKTYRFRVRSGNDFGESAWVEGTQFYVPATSNTNRPVVVTDLRVASSNATSITLRWSAPYSLDSHDQPSAAASYDIRIATTPILDSWNLANTNPLGMTSWAAATSINSVPYSATVPTPVSYPATQEVTVTCPTGATYFVAMKSSNGVNSSYISNVTGALVGSAGGSGGSLTWVLTLESRAGTGGHGINHFSLPFPGPWYAYTTGGTALGAVANAYDLVKAINTAAGGNVVSTFSAWLGAEQLAPSTGVILPDEDPEAVRTQLQAIALENGRGFELYATRSAKLVIKNF